MARRFGGSLVVLVLLTAAIYVANPFWFGDAPWYANDLAASQPLRADVGHLLWRPLGQLAWRGWTALSPTADPLTALRILSSAFTAVACWATRALALRMGFSNGAAFAAGLFLAGCQVSLAYGGSGCSYTAAMAFGVLAAAVLIPRDGREWGAREALPAALLMVASWSMWGVATLLVPGFGMVALLYAGGGPVRRTLRAGLLCAGVGLSIASLAYLYFATLVAHHGDGRFLSWLSSSSHGSPPRISLIGALRAVYGLLVGVTYLGDLGTALKGIILGDRSLTEGASVVWPALVLLIGLPLAGLAALGLIRAVRRGDRTAVRTAAIALAALAPSAAFAAVWQGSDIERFALAIPFLGLALAYGMCSAAGRLFPTRIRAARALAIAFALVVSLGNFAGLVVPRAVFSKSLGAQLTQVAGARMGRDDLLILCGEKFGPDVWAPATYLAKREIYSISYDLQSHGPLGWSERLAARVRSAKERGGSIYALADLVGHPTPGGIGFSRVEFPEPNPGVGDIVEFFGDSAAVAAWDVGEFSFYRLERLPGGDRPGPGAPAAAVAAAESRGPCR